MSESSFRTVRFASVVALLVTVAPVPALHAAAPTNDTCASAIIIPGDGPFPFPTPIVSIAEAMTGSVEMALTNTAAGFCSAPVSRGVWYTFTPATNGFYTFATCSGATTVDDTVMALYTASASCSGFSLLECRDEDGCGSSPSQAFITRLLSKDILYYVVVWKYGTEAPSAGESFVQLMVTRETPPANDTCATAEPVLMDKRIVGSTILATNNYQVAGTNAFWGIGQRPRPGVGLDVVYSFVAPETGEFSIRVLNYSTASGWDLMVYAGGYCAPGAGPQWMTNCLAASNRNPATSAEEIFCLPLTNGQLIYIYVDDTNLNTGSTFTLEITHCTRETEPNDSIASGTPLVCGIAGSIFPVADSDFYKVGTFPADSRLFALVVGEAANMTDFDLRATTLTNTLEFDRDDTDERYGRLSANVAGALLPEEPLFLRVNYNDSLSVFTAEPYRLYAVVQPPLASAASESEPNNTPETANTDPRHYFHGTLIGPSPSLDRDLYEFMANEGDLVFISLDCDPLRNLTPINGQLELLDESGGVLLSVNDFNNVSNTNQSNGTLGGISPNSPGEAIVYRCAAGRYLVRVGIGDDQFGLPQIGPSGSGDYLLSIARNCFVGSAGQNTAPTLADLAVTPSVEGGMATLTGSVFDPDLGDLFTVTVSWGDGAIDIINAPTAGLLRLNLTHTYADDQPTGTAADNYTVSINVVDRLGASAFGTTPALVNNLPPALTNVAVTTPVAVGSNAVLTGSISDPCALDWFTLTVNWGDGSAAQNFSYPAGAAGFMVTHAYSLGGTNYAINITLTDDDTSVATTSTQIVVEASAQPARFLGLTDLANGHKQLQLQGTPGASYRIEWSADLVTWATMTNVVANPAGDLLAEDSSPSPASRFYRAVAP